MVDYNRHEPTPKNTSDVFIWDLVKKDMDERDKLGEKKYGCRLSAFNGRDSLKDAYQEVLDLAVYLRQELYRIYGE
jgi:hypothetical protein